MKKHLFILIIALFSGKIFSQEFTITSEPIYNYTIDRYTNEIYYMQNYPNQHDVHKTNFDGSNNIKTDFRSTPFFANNSHTAVVLELTGDDEISYFLFNFETSEKKYLFKTNSRMYLVDISFSWDDSLIYVYNDPLIYYSFKDSTLYMEDTIIDADGEITWHKDNDRLVFIDYNYIGSYSILNGKFDTLVVLNNYDEDSGYDELYCFAYNSKTDLLVYGYGRDTTHWSTSIYELDINSGIKKELLNDYPHQSLGRILEMTWNAEGTLLAFTNTVFIDPKIQDLHLFDYCKDTTYLYLKDVWQTSGSNWLDNENIVFINTGLGGYKFDKPLSVEKVTSERVNVALSCYPNPFNTSTIIKYSIPSIQTGGGFVTLKIYDILGREVATLVNEKQNAGNYEVIFDANNLSSGIYLYMLQSDYYSESKKMILLK